jgi:hypothetical protein
LALTKPLLTNAQNESLIFTSACLVANPKPPLNPFEHPPLARNRKEFFEVRRPAYLNDTQSDFADMRCEEIEDSFAAYIRMLINQDMKRWKELSQQKQIGDRAKPVPNRDQPNGLLTYEQALDLHERLSKK